jgi:hypothetical protein
MSRVATKVTVQHTQNAGYRRTILETVNLFREPDDAVINITNPLIKKNNSTPR